MGTIIHTSFKRKSGCKSHLSFFITVTLGVSLLCTLRSQPSAMQPAAQCGRQGQFSAQSLSGLYLEYNLPEI